MSSLFGCFSNACESVIGLSITLTSCILRCKTAELLTLPCTRIIRPGPFAVVLRYSDPLFELEFADDLQDANLQSSNGNTTHIVLA